MQIGILEFVLTYSDMYDPAEKIAIPPDAADNKLMECAVAARARVVITGDKKFLSIRRHGHVSVLSTQDFLQNKKRS